MEAEHAAPGVFRPEALLHNPCPQAAGGPELGHLFQHVRHRPEEKRYARGEPVHVETRTCGGLDIRDSVGEREANLLRRRRARLANVISADADRVEAGYVLSRIGEDVGDQPQRRRGWKDVCAAGDVLLEYVILDRARELVSRDALLGSNGDVHRQEHGRGGIDGHRGRDFVERNGIEKNLHVGQRVDGYADPADLAN